MIANNMQIYGDKLEAIAVVEKNSSFNEYKKFDYVVCSIEKHVTLITFPLMN